MITSLMAIGFDNDMNVERNIITCSLESSRFDMSHVVVDNGVFEILASASDPHLGSDNL